MRSSPVSQRTPVLKQVIVVRTDLNMSPGKLAVQVAHASTLLVEALRDETEIEQESQVMTQAYLWYKEWKSGLYRKIVVTASSEDELTNIREMAVKARLPTVEVYDAGLTELPPNTLTCVGIGPAPSDIIDDVTGNLKLL